MRYYWLYTLYAQGKKSVKGTTFDTFLRRVNFILTFFPEKLASLLSARNPKAKKSKNFPITLTMVTRQRGTDFSKLVNLCPI